MAQCLNFVCSHCLRAVEAWSDGNPYYIDEAGAKRYAYHPDDDKVARCVGNDTPHLCLSCGLEFIVDSRAPIHACPRCGTTNFSSTYGLQGRRCPYCTAGEFRETSNDRRIS